MVTMKQEKSHDNDFSFLIKKHNIKEKIKWQTLQLIQKKKLH